MVDFSSFTLSNGLRVLVHEDPTVDIAVVNILYDVGSRDEQPDKTGFAHLFEHLMFGGSKHIPNYDEPLQRAGGENNAFTNNDITNYYLTVPAANLETGFWLESDRMLSLSFDPEVLTVQRNVVVEEFRQRYLNQPYGDAWLKLRPLCYHVHPYQWATIGKEISHIEHATLDDVRDFFFRYYVPSNAILVVAGKVTRPTVEALAEKWFAGIPSGRPIVRSLPAEPPQLDRRELTVKANVPAHALYKAFHMPGRFEPGYYAADLLTDVLGRGESSRLYQRLVKEQEIFASISSFSMGSIDPGLMLVNGRLREGRTFTEAEEALDEVLSSVTIEGISDEELEKIQNQAAATLEFGEVELMNRAMNLAFATLSGNPNLVNEEAARIAAVSKEDIQRMATEILTRENSNVLYYEALNGQS